MPQALEGVDAENIWNTEQRSHCGHKENEDINLRIRKRGNVSQNHFIRGPTKTSQDRFLISSLRRKHYNLIIQ